jgi:hypothetical protein
VQAVAVEGGSSAAGIHPDNQTPLLKKLSALNFSAISVRVSEDAGASPFSDNKYLVTGFTPNAHELFAVGSAVHNISGGVSKAVVSKSCATQLDNFIPKVKEVGSISFFHPIQRGNAQQVQAKISMYWSTELPHEICISAEDVEPFAGYLHRLHTPYACHGGEDHDTKAMCKAEVCRYIAQDLGLSAGMLTDALPTSTGSQTRSLGQTAPLSVGSATASLTSRMDSSMVINSAQQSTRGLDALASTVEKVEGGLVAGGNKPPGGISLVSPPAFTNNMAVTGSLRDDTDLSPLTTVFNQYCDMENVSVFNQHCDMENGVISVNQLRRLLDAHQPVSTLGKLYQLPNALLTSSQTGFDFQKFAKHYQICRRCGDQKHKQLLEDAMPQGGAAAAAAQNARLPIVIVRKIPSVRLGFRRALVRARSHSLRLMRSFSLSGLPTPAGLRGHPSGQLQPLQVGLVPRVCRKREVQRHEPIQQVSEGK